MQRSGAYQKKRRSLLKRTQAIRALLFSGLGWGGTAESVRIMLRAADASCRTSACIMSGRSIRALDCPRGHRSDHLCSYYISRISIACGVPFFHQPAAQHRLQDAAKFLQRLIGNRSDDAVVLQQCNLLVRPRTDSFADFGRNDDLEFARDRNVQCRLTLAPSHERSAAGERHSSHWRSPFATTVFGPAGRLLDEKGVHNEGCSSSSRTVCLYESRATA